MHRDLKLANLILTSGGIVKVLDFGVSALLGAGENPRLTRVGTTVGTPPYMSPEQALGNAVGPTSDVYALACVLHHVQTPPTPVRLLRPGAPEKFEALLLEMLRKEAEARPHAIEVYDQLFALASEPEEPFPADIAELDPCLPFIRPLGAMLRRAARQAPARTEPTVSLLERDVAEAVEWAWELMDDGRLTRPSAPERGPSPKVGIALRGGVSLSWVSGWTHSTRARARGSPAAGVIEPRGGVVGVGA